MAHNGNDERDPVQLSLSNTVIFRHILTFLPFNDLKSCSEVNKIWKFEVRSYIRDFRVCNVALSEARPCFDLERLNQTLGQMDIIPINSLTIELIPGGHTICSAETYNADRYAHLLNKLPLKHLYLSWLAVKNCPANVFIVNLLRESAEELQSLNFHYCDALNLDEYFEPSWKPWMPQLKVLDFGTAKGWLSEHELFQKMIRGAPNLKSIRGMLDPGLVTLLPDDKLKLCNNFQFYMSSPLDIENCLKLADIGPQLKKLLVHTPFLPSAVEDRSLVQSFYVVLQKLFSSSQNTLEELSVTDNIFPLSRLNFPPLVDLKILRIRTHTTTAKLLHVIKSIDYPRLLPSLREVQILAEDGGGDLVYALVPDDLAHENVHSSKSVSKLKIQVNIRRVRFQQLQAVFPSLSSLKLRPSYSDYSRVPYEYLWETWPELESLEVIEGYAALAHNSDAAFLGIHPDELEYLSGQHDEFLANFHLVPIRPSILSMKNLKNLDISFKSGDYRINYLEGTNKVFLSRVTGFLALHQTRSPRLRVRIITSYNDYMQLALKHLRPFATVCREVGHSHENGPGLVNCLHTQLCF